MAGYLAISNKENNAQVRNKINTQNQEQFNRIEILEEDLVNMGIQSSQWKSTTTYGYNDITSYNGIFYKSIQNINLNKIPSSSPTYWDLIWSNTISYDGSISGLSSTNVKTAIDELQSEKQPLDSTLTALASYNTNGILTQTNADTFVGRSITGTSGKINVANGNGVNGNPTITIGNDVFDKSVNTMDNITDGTTYVKTENNYTDTEKTKLGGIESNAQVNTITSVNGKTGSVTISKSDVGLGNLDNVQQAPISHVGTGGTAHSIVNTDTAGFMSSIDKTKLDGIATNANNYTHPINHSPSIITQDESNRFVSDTEKSNWNGKENAITTGTTSQYYRGDKTWQTLDKTSVGLGNVSNADTTNASNITSGTLNDERLSSNVTVQGNTFNSANKLVQLDSNGKLPAIDGSQLTGITSSGSGHTIQDEGVSLTQRTKLNFVGSGVTVTDDSNNNATIVTIPSGGSSDITFDSNFIVSTNAGVKNVTMGSAVEKAFTGTQPSEIITADGNYEIYGESYAHDTTKALMSVGGTLLTKKSDNSTMESVVIPTLRFLDYITLSGNRVTYDGTIPSLYLSGRTWTKHPTLPYYWAWGYQASAPTYTTTQLPDHRCSHLPAITYEQLASGVNGVSLMTDGRLAINVTGISDLTALTTWLNANTPIIYYRHKNGTYTTASYDNTIMFSQGGTITYTDTNSITPKSLSYKGYTNIVNAPIGYSTPQTTNHTVSNQPNSAIGGISYYLLKGISSPITGTSNPYTRPNYTAIPTTQGILTAKDSSNNTVSTVDIPTLYGNSNIQDQITPDGITRKFSEEYAFSSAWTWVKYGGTTTSGGSLWQTEISGSSFAKKPAQVTSSIVMNMISDKFTVVSENAIATTTLGSVSMSYNSGTDTYKLSVLISSSIATDSAGVNYVLVNVSKSYIRYELYTYETTTLTNLLFVKKGGNVSFSITSGQTTYYSLSIDSAINVSANLETGFNKVANAVNNLNTAVNNLGKGSSALKGDGVTDDSVAIQDLLNKAKSALTGIATPVILPSGKYYIGSTIIIPTDTILDGGSSTLITNNTGIDVVQLNGSRAELKNINIELPVNSMGSGVKVLSANAVLYCKIENVRVTGNLVNRNSSERSYGIFLEDGDSINTFNNYNSILNCEVSHVYYGLYNGLASVPNVISNFVFDYCVYGIYVKGMGNKFEFKGHYRTDFSLAGVYCSGKFNRFEGFSFDPQRTQNSFYFTSSSQNNSYLVNTYFNDNFVLNGIISDVGEGNYREAELVFDAGKDNVCMSKTKPNLVDSFIGHRYVTGADNDAINYSTPYMYGMQDNCLAYADKWGTVSLNSNTIASGQLSDLFDINGGTNGFINGVTFGTDSEITPIVLEMQFNNPIKNMSKFGIKFNNHIGQKIKLEIKTSSGGGYNTYCDVTKNKLANWYVQIHHANTLIYGIRLTIYSSYYTTLYNTSKQCGIALIWGTSGYNGGNSYMKSGGGNFYGDIAMNQSYVGLGMVTTLPAASVAYRGKTIILTNDGVDDDKVYTCKRLSDNSYSWVQIG